MSEWPLTARMLEAYALCPAKYDLYRLGDPARGLTRRVDASRALHAAVRQALEKCYRAGGPGDMDVGRVVELFLEAFDGSACADSREEDENRAAGVRMLRGYHEDRLGDVADEVRVGVELSGEIGGLPFEARADRRELRTDGRVVLLLCTTARRPPTEGPLERDMQTGALQLLGEEAEGRPVTIEVHGLRTRRTLIATKPAEPLEEVRARIVGLGTAAREATAFPAVRGRHCRWCHARGVCPGWRGR